MTDFLDGTRLLLRGWGYWRKHPGAMVLGVIPAAIAAMLVLTVLLVLVLNLGRISDALTGFADGWPSPWPLVVDLAARGLVLAAAVVLIVVTFTGMTLAIGEPFYDRIWRAVEETEHGAVPTGDTGRWRGALDGLFLTLRGLVTAVVAGTVGLIPVVGTVLGWVTGVLLTGWVLSHELTTRALVARGIERRHRNRLLRAHRRRAVGFGTATQLCFLVPGGAIATMPAAIAGSALLAHSLVGGAGGAGALPGETGGADATGGGGPQAA